MVNQHSQLFAAGVLCLLTGQAAAVSPTWQDFVDAESNGTQAILPDFSWAGYRYSEVPLPDVTHTVFNVMDYGAIPDDGVSDRGAIIAAISAAETNGSGVVFFPPGRFHLNTTTDVGSTIFIRSGNIVLRGSGSDENGTELFMEAPFPPDDPDVMSSTPFMIQVLPLNTGEGQITTIIGNAARGSREVQVANANNLSVGQVITVYLRDPNASASFLQPYTAHATWSRLATEGIQVRERHEIVAKSGNTLTFAEPLHVDIDATHDWQVRHHRFVTEVGFEDIAFVGNWKGNFVHHLNALHDGGWSALRIHNVRDGWIRRCRFTDWNWAVFQDNCTRFTIIHTTLDGNPGHHSFQTRRSYGVLVALSRDLAAHWHGPGVGYQSAGTVYWEYEYLPDSSWDSHSGTPYATLLDATSGGMKYGRSGGPLEGMPNHLRHFVLWNFEHTGATVSNYDFWRAGFNQRDRFLNPIIVGFHGSNSTFNAAHLEVMESMGTPVEPASLFEAQLDLRLGGAPSWLDDAKTEWEAIKSGVVIPNPSGTSNIWKMY